MGGIAKSVGGLIGLDTGDKAPQGQFSNASLGQLQQQTGVTGNEDVQNRLSGYSTGKYDTNTVLNNNLGLNPNERQGLSDALATGSTTGSKFATEQIQNNPMLAGLYGQNGAMANMANNLNSELGQGYQLQPQDQTMYGQAAGQIARNFGQQGNQAASNLASRGLSNSGAAGATFSGLAGNQNEQLANAQTQIMNQRFQNTMQQANTLNQMGANAQNALQQQYGRQLSGAQNQQGALSNAANMQANQNNAENAYNMGAAQFNAANTPANLADIGIAAGANFIGGAASGAGQKAGASMFGGSSSPSTTNGGGSQSAGGGLFKMAGMA